MTTLKHPWASSTQASVEGLYAWGEQAVVGLGGVGG